MDKKYIYLVEKESNGDIKITYNRKISGDSVDLTDAVLAMNLEWITEENNWTSTFPMTNRPDVVGEVTKTGTYGFKTSNSTLIAENKGINSTYTTADSYIKIDLSGYTTDYTADLTINAKFSGYYSSYGWLVVTENENAIGYYNSSYLKDTVTNTKISKTASNIMMYANGNNNTWKTNKDYTYTFDGGKCYYLHFGYYRYSNYSTYGDDTLTINNISFKEKRKVPKITLSTETQGVNIQYMVENKDGKIVTDWTDGDKILTITDNGTERYLTYGDIIYGQMKTGENTSAISQINIQDGEAPVIEITATNTYSDEITVTVNNVKDNCGLPETVLYDYYITEDGNDYPKKSENSEPTKSKSYTFTGLTQKKTYKIKVVTHDAWNNEGYAETTMTTVAVPQGAVINVDWNQGNPSVYITVRSSSYSHYKIQYQVNTTNKDSWKETSSGSYLTDVAYGDTVYARLMTDEENTSGYSSVILEDNTKPYSDIFYSGSSSNIESGMFEMKYTINGMQYRAGTGDYLQYNILQYDNESGVNIESCKWILSTSINEIGQEYILTNGNSFNSTDEYIYPQVNSDGIYYLHVLTTDYRGNYYECIESTGVCVTNSVSWEKINDDMYGFFQMGDQWSSTNGGCDDTRSYSEWYISLDNDIDYNINYYVSSEINHDYLRIYLDGMQIVETSGEEWNSYAITLNSGMHYLSAEYSKDSANSEGSDYAYLQLPDIVFSNSSSDSKETEIYYNEISWEQIIYKDSNYIQYISGEWSSESSDSAVEYDGEKWIYTDYSKITWQANLECDTDYTIITKRS